MAEELRSYYSDLYIDHVAYHLAESINGSAADIKCAIVSAPWHDMALKERMARLTSVLTKFLPDDYKKSIKILKHLLPEISGGTHKYDDFLSMFVPDYTALHGMKDLKTSFDALEYFTSHGTSSEFAIRPFIIANQDIAMERMKAWATHEHSHVRRFASEGCRPRLPWAMSLPELKKDPAPVIPILDLLVHDESKFVRKSVANNLNDIAKDNPATVIEFAKKHKGTHKDTDWIIKHGCRTLLKLGNSDVLELFGSNNVSLIAPKLTLQSHSVIFGEDLLFNFSAEIKEPLPDNLRLEYAIDFMKANGKTSRKIFKILEKKPNTRLISVSKKHTFISYTTRKHYPGEHSMEIFVNGKGVAIQTFNLLMPD